MIQDVEEAFRDSFGPFLRVHVKLIVGTSPHMLAVGVGAVVGEPPLPLVTTALETSLPSDKDFLRPETDFWQYEVFCWQWRQALPWHRRHIEGNVPLLSLVLLCQS